MALAFLPSTGVVAACLFFQIGFPAYAATCGSKEVRDTIENQSVDYLKNAKQQLESSKSRSEYGDASLKNYSQDYKFVSSSNFMIGEDGDVKHCKGSLTISLPDGAHLAINMTYDVISTEDGNLIVNQNGIAHASPAETAAQYFMAFGKKP